jgi:hypothetical protein
VEQIKRERGGGVLLGFARERRGKEREMNEVGRVPCKGETSFDKKKRK